MTDQEQIQDRPLRLGLLTIIVTLLAAFTAGVAIAAELSEIALLQYIAKIVTIVLIGAVAYLSYDLPSRAYKWTIILGLALSLLGDILLMVPPDLFLYGLIAFAAAQIVYTVAFAGVGGFYRNLRAIVPFLLFGVFMAAFLWAGFVEDGVLIPGLAYLIIILIMAWQAYGQWRQTGERRAFLAFIGALLFIASDSLLAVNRFLYDLENLAPFLVLGTYYPAQWLIGQSAGRRHV